MAERIRKILFFAIVFCSGVVAAFVACRVNGEPFGVYLWPVIACVDGFVLAAVGFFHTEGKREILYGACSAACLFCGIVQLALIF